MIVDIVFGAIFLIALGTLWYFVTAKLPVLAAVPEEVARERLYGDSLRARGVLRRTVTFYRDERFRIALKEFVGKMLYRMHITLLRIDNGVVLLLKKMRANGSFQNGNGNGNGNKYSWGELKRTEDIRPKE